MTSEELARKLRSLAETGIVNARKDAALLREAAAWIEEMDRLLEDAQERIAIMMEGNRIQPGDARQMDMRDYEYRDEIRR